MLKDAQRRTYDVALFWAIDRFGKSLIDLLNNMQHLEQCGVDLYLDQQNTDTTAPPGKLLFQVTGAFAEFERTMIRTRINLRTIKNKLLEQARELLSQGLGIRTVAKQVGLGNSTVANLKTVWPHDSNFLPRFKPFYFTQMLYRDTFSSDKKKPVERWRFDGLVMRRNVLPSLLKPKG